MYGIGGGNSLPASPIKKKRGLSTALLYLVPNFTMTITTFQENSRISAKDSPETLAIADCTGLVPAQDWCAKHDISARETAVIVELQNRKAALDLDYILAVGELVLDAQRALQGKLYEQCLKEVLGISPRSGARYSQIYLLKQQVPELSQASVDALSIQALTAIESARKSYELTEEQKRLVIEEAERRVRDQEKLLTERTISDLKHALKEEAVLAARSGLQELLDDQSGKINTQKEKITTLLNTVEELRAKMGKESSSAEIAQAAMTKPVEGSVNDRATPSLALLKSGELKTKDGVLEIDVAEVQTVTRWLAEKRKSIEQDIKEFDEIYEKMQTQYQRRGRSYNLFWEGVDRVWQDLPGTTAWKQAYGVSGNREKALKAFALKIAGFGHKIMTIDKQTHYREGEFRIVD